MGFTHKCMAEKVRVAFLSSIYPKHAEIIYNENPDLKNKSSEDQMHFIRWNAALSTTIRRFDFLEEHGVHLCNFNCNLPQIALAWAKENNFVPRSSNPVMEIGIETLNINFYTLRLN